MREYTTPGEVQLPEGANLLHPLWHHASETPDRPLLAYRDGDRFVDVTAAQFAARVQQLARGLVGLGVEADERVAIMSSTRIEWTYLDYAILAAGAATVPIYETSSPDQIEWILSDSGARFAFFATDDLYKQYLEIADRVPLDRTFVIDQGGLEEVDAAGEGVDHTVLELRGEQIGPETLATIIYTSGTMGRPKGCIATHGNYRWDAIQAVANLEELFTPSDRTLLFLPLAHSFAKLIQVGSIEAGVTIGYATSPQHLIEELPLFKPTFLLSVPRIWEKVYNGAVAKANEEGKGKIFQRAVDVAVKYSRGQQKGSVGLGTRIQHAIFDRLVYSRLRERLGGELRNAVSGGAALGERLGHFYNGIGVTVLEGYGLTETSAGATSNRPDSFRIGSVGRPFPGCTVRIGDDGEVLIKGGNVFKGYWQNEEATKEDLDDEGWFYSGDVGELDDDGFLYITGRKKELIVTAGGKNVAPNVLEDGLRSHRLVSQSMVVGDDKPFIAALVTIDPEEFPRWAEQHGKAGKSVSDVTDDPDLRAEIEGAIANANKSVSRAESIREFRILPEDFTIEGGELTPTLKVKRRVVADKYAHVIDDIYP
ncbi:MAG: AMP-dependent synthetase/ligase [Nitriliruptorales bacterium]